MSHAVRGPGAPGPGMGFGLLAGEAGRTQLAALVEATQEPIWSRTVDGVILSWNAAAEELFGYGASDVIGRSVDPTLPPDRENEVSERIRLLVDGESSVERFETVRRTRDGRLLDVHISISPILDDGGHVAALSLVARDVTARKRAEAHLDRIHELSVALGRALTADDVVRTVVGELRRVAGVRRAWVGLVHEGEIEVIHEDGVETTEPRVGLGLAPHERRPSAEVVRTGEALWFPSWRELLRRFPAVEAALHGPVQGAWAILPLIVDEAVIGVASLGFDGDGAFGEAEKSYFLSVARQCAQALERARLFEAERAARAEAEAAAERQARLREIGELIARAETPADVINVLMSRGVRDFGADRGAVLLLEDGALSVVGSIGYPDDIADRFGRLPIDANSPASDAVRDGEPIFLEDPTALARAYPLALETGILVSSSAAFVPISVSGHPVGAIAIGFDRPHRFSPADRQYLQILGGQYAQAIERTRLREAERSSAVRSDLLARASSLLSGSLDYGSALEQIVRLVVPTIADWCFLAVVDGHGGAARVMHGTPAEHALTDDDIAQADRAVMSMATGDDSRKGVPSGLPRLLEDVGDAASAALGETQRAAFAALGAKSAILVPLLAHGDPLGILVFLASGRAFSRADLALAEDMAQRVATAIENARLYENLRLLARAERAQAAELAAVIQAIGEPVVVFDPAGRVRLANQAAMSIVRGGRFERYADLAARFEPSDGLPHASNGSSGPVQLHLRGSDRWFELTAYPVQPRDARLNPTLVGSERPDGEEAVSMILLGRDVTAVRQANRLREAFIGMLSHELRTPITTIFGGTRILRREGLPEDVRREVFADVTEEAERLHRLVEDLLVLARAERGGIDVGGEPVLLQHLLPPVVASESTHWPRSRIETDIPGGMPPVSADATYVEQVVRNLLSNAVKYSPPGSVIELRAETVEDEVHVTIADEGPGFPAEEAGRLFELFYRLPSTAATSKGAGIGLFVCRALIDAMGGRIWANPRPAGGAEFGFALPVISEDGD